MEAARIGGRRAAAVASTRKSEWSAAVSELIAVIKAVRAISPLNGHVFRMNPSGARRH